LISVVFERSFIHIEFIKFFHYTDCFLFLAKNLADRHFYPIPHWIFIVEAGFLLLSFLMIKRKMIDKENIFFVLLLGMSLFLTVPLSSLIWKYLPEFSNLQFPWRWLMFSGLSVSVLSGAFIEQSKESKRTITGLFLLIMLILSFLSARQVSFFTHEDIEHWTRSSVLYSPIEYRPIWLNEHRRNLPPVEKITIVKGTGTVDIIEWKAHQRIIVSEEQTDLTLRFSTFYFPGWKGYLDGTEIAINIENGTGAMLIDIPKGEHILELKFVDTPVRFYGKLISLISLIALGGFLVIDKFRKASKIKT
jgi:hypothetical protein